MTAYTPADDNPDGCSSACWTPVPCPTCGSPLPPRGASVPIEANISDCCEEARYAKANRRHLWCRP